MQHSELTAEIVPVSSLASQAKGFIVLRIVPSISWSPSLSAGEALPAGTVETTRTGDAPGKPYELAAIRELEAGRQQSGYELRPPENILKMS